MKFLDMVETEEEAKVVPNGQCLGLLIEGDYRVNQVPRCSRCDKWMYHSMCECHGEPVVAVVFKDAPHTFTPIPAYVCACNFYIIPVGSSEDSKFRHQDYMIFVPDEIGKLVLDPEDDGRQIVEEKPN